MQYDFNLPPGGGLSLDVKGRFFKYRSGTGPIRVRASKGGYVDLMPGQGVWSLDYDSLNVQDRSGAQNAGVLIAGDFDFHDDRIAGTVDVVDGGKARTLAGIAFMSNGAITSPAGQYAAVQLWNPPGSLKSLIVEKISMGHTSQGLIDMGRSTVALNTMGEAAINKRLGAGSVTAAQGRKQIGAVLPMVAADVMFSSMASAFSPLILPLNEPIVIGPGTGICVMSETQNVALNACFEYFEEPL